MINLKVIEMCDTCKYYMGIEDDEGCCRRYPPKVSRKGTYQPAVRYDEWCGEYRYSLNKEEQEIIDLIFTEEFTPPGEIDD